MNKIKLNDIYEKLNEITSLEYVNDKAIINLKNNPGWHVKMPRHIFSEIENKYYEQKMSKIIPSEFSYTENIRANKIKIVDIDIEKLKEMYVNLKRYHEIAEYFDCSIEVIKRTLKELFENGKLEKRKFYSKQTLFVIENYGKLSNRDIAKKLNTKISTIQEISWRLRKQGIIKVEEQ